MSKKFYITTSIPYVNAAPHLGHALEFVQTDTLARYHRLLNEDVHFLTGTDENALKNVRAAEEKNISVQELVKINSDKFFELKKTLNLSFDDFIRTTEKRHIIGSQALWQACQKDIYKKTYKGLYCLGCEAFYAEEDLIEGKCPEHQTQPEEIEEENYFFKLSAYQQALEKLIVSDKLSIIPQTRKNEVLAFIRRGLEDFSVSRSFKRAHGWGIPVPDDPTQIIYVWFDALANYITALGYGTSDGTLFESCWPADLHVIGKGIARFHAIYWPAMLLSAGLSLPKAEFIHGYVTVEGQKISKSLGNVIDPFEEVKKYGTDAIRYYLLREIPAYGDGDFSESRFKDIYNADLANGLGNLVARVAKLCESADFSFPQSKETTKEILERYQLIYKQLFLYRFDEYLRLIFLHIKELDLLLDREKPWGKVSFDKKEVERVLALLVNGIRETAILLLPALPETAKKILTQFAGPKIKSETPLFPRL